MEKHKLKFPESCQGSPSLLQKMEKPSHDLPKTWTNQLLEEPPKGLPLFSAFQSTGKNPINICRSPTVLGLQHEIKALEKRLDRLDQVNLDKNQAQLCTEHFGKKSDVGDSYNTRYRPGILHKIQAKLTEYGQLLERCGSISPFPANRDTQCLRTWLSQSHVGRSSFEGLRHWLLPEQSSSTLTTFSRRLQSTLNTSLIPRISAFSAIAMFIAPVSAQSNRTKVVKMMSGSGGKEASNWMEWTIGGFLAGILVLVLANFWKNPTGPILNRLKVISTPAMVFSSIAFLVLRNGDSAEAKMAWAPFLVWFVSTPAYVRAHQEFVSPYQIYMASSAILTGVLTFTIGSFQQESLSGGVVTVLPTCASFSLWVCGVAFRTRIQCSFSLA
jgi:hypothetical protein